MRALVQKEVRENVKLAALGLVIQTLLLVAQYRAYVASPTNMAQPLADESLLWSTAWFCGIFGAVLGWLQIYNERRPDLWAFLLHRPMTRTQIFLGKTLAGLGLYAVVVGVPLLVFILWALWPGHVAAPFEPAMLLPLAAYVLAGMLYYFAGMLTGLRQARWYASRALGLGFAIVVSFLLPFWPAFWHSLVLVLVGAAILATAAWGAFQSDGYYRGQPAWAKAALTVALLSGAAILLCVAAFLLSSFFPPADGARQWNRYCVTTAGAIYKVTERARGPGEIVDLEGKPLNDPKTGRMIELAAFKRSLAREYTIGLATEGPGYTPLWMGEDRGLAIELRATSDTLWYYWRRYDRLVGYDIKTRRCIGSLGPQGFTRDLTGNGDRFSNEWPGGNSRTLRTATALYAVHLDQRAVRPLFTTRADDPILKTFELALSEFEWEYTAVVTKRFIHLLTPEGQAVWKVPYEPKGAAYSELAIHFLDQPGQFVLWKAPSYPASVQAGWKLPIYVSWVARGQGVVRSTELPELPFYDSGPRTEQKLLAAVMPPALLVIVPHLWISLWERLLPLTLLPLSLAGAVFVCIPIGLWLGARYRFSPAAQAGWAVFHLVFGLPGLLAFLSVQEWPAREACPNCKRLRLVDRAQCEHCGADFAPPEKTGTEVFAPLVASS